MPHIDISETIRICLRQCALRHCRLWRVRDPRQRARAVLCGVGRGYLGFLRHEPGLFRTAFAARPFGVDEFAPDDDSPRGDGGMDPFQLLSHALDGMVERGLLTTPMAP